jgi:hypothetical protein
VAKLGVCPNIQFTWNCPGYGPGRCKSTLPAAENDIPNNLISLPLLLHAWHWVAWWLGMLHVPMIQKVWLSLEGLQLEGVVTCACWWSISHHISGILAPWHTTCCQFPLESWMDHDSFWCICGLVCALMPCGSHEWILSAWGLVPKSVLWGSWVPLWNAYPSWHCKGLLCWMAHHFSRGMLLLHKSCTAACFNVVLVAGVLQCAQHVIWQGLSYQKFGAGRFTSMARGTNGKSAHGRVVDLSATLLSPYITCRPALLHPLPGRGAHLAGDYCIYLVLCGLVLSKYHTICWCWC